MLLSEEILNEIAKLRELKESSPRNFASLNRTMNGIFKLTKDGICEALHQTHAVWVPLLMKLGAISLNENAETVNQKYKIDTSRLNAIYVALNTTETDLEPMDVMCDGFVNISYERRIREHENCFDDVTIAHDTMFLINNYVNIEVILYQTFCRDKTDMSLCIKNGDANIYRFQLPDGDCNRRLLTMTATELYDFDNYGQKRFRLASSARHNDDAAPMSSPDVELNVIFMPNNIIDVQVKHGEQVFRPLTIVKESDICATLITPWNKERAYLHA